MTTCVRRQFREGSTGFLADVRMGVLSEHPCKGAPVDAADHAVARIHLAQRPGGF
ncbi:MAG: hypothetical protein HY596_04655, partial [Candidatus Omnitrophica bacterium]|nr:hypothetical protein [Candidatus Omnitrophota bacterium]